MESMVFNSFRNMFWIFFAHKLIIYTNAVVRQGFSMAIADTFTHLQKFLVILHSFLILLNIIIEHPNRIIRSPLIPNFTSPSTAKSQHLIIFQSPLHSNKDSIINFIMVKNFIILCFIGNIFIFNKSTGSVKK
jgi:hypothetical protein